MLSSDEKAANPATALRNSSPPEANLSLNTSSLIQALALFSRQLNDLLTHFFNMCDLLINKMLASYEDRLVSRQFWI